MNSTPSSPRRRGSSMIMRTRNSHSLEPRHGGADGHACSTPATTPSFSVSNVGIDGAGAVVPGQDSQIKFAITSQSLNSQKSMDEQYTDGKATTYTSAVVYNPMPNVSGRSSELANTFFVVEVKLLSDDQPPLYVEVSAAVLGQWLFDKVLDRIGGVLEREYFGLRYLDKNKQRVTAEGEASVVTPSSKNFVKQWLDLSKTVYKQLKNVIPRSLNFRVKHYPARPLEELKQEKSRYFLYLQLRRDLHSGRLIGRTNDMHVLAAHILQAEIGDIDQLEDYLGKNGSLADLKMFENMTPRVEAKIRDIYKTLRGTSTADAEAQFLERSSEIETYGVEPVFVQDRKGNHFYVGLSHEGVTTFRGNRKAHVFMWSKIHRISYDGKLFIIQVEWEQRRHTLGFKCQTSEASEALWKWAVDRQCFFTLNRSTDAKRSKASGRLFRRRQLYTFTGRCQKEMLQMTSSMPNIPQPSVKRSRSLLNIARNVGLSRQTRSHEELHRTHTLPNCNTNPPLNHSSVQNLHIETDNKMRLVGVASESADFSEIPVRLHEESIIRNLTNQEAPQVQAVSRSSPSLSPPNLSPTTAETAEVHRDDGEELWPSVQQSPPVTEKPQEQTHFESTENLKDQPEVVQHSPVTEDENSEAMTHAQVMRLVKQQKMQSLEEGPTLSPPMQSQSFRQYTPSHSTDRQVRVSVTSSETERSRRINQQTPQVPASNSTSRSPSPSSSPSSNTSQPSVVQMCPENIEAGASQQIPVSVTVHPGAVLPSAPLNYDIVDTGPSSSSSNSPSPPDTSPEPSPSVQPVRASVLQPRAAERDSTKTAPIATRPSKQSHTPSQENANASSSLWNPYPPIAFADDSDSSTATRTKCQKPVVTEETQTASRNLYFPYLSRVSIMSDSRSTLAPLFVSTDSSYLRPSGALRASATPSSFSPSSCSATPEATLATGLVTSNPNETVLASSSKPAVVYTNPEFHPNAYKPSLPKLPNFLGPDQSHQADTTSTKTNLPDKSEASRPADEVALRSPYRLTSLTSVSTASQRSTSTSNYMPHRSFIYSRADGNAGLGECTLGDSSRTQVASSLGKSMNTSPLWARENDRLSGSLPSRGPLFSFSPGIGEATNISSNSINSCVPQPQQQQQPSTTVRADNSLLLRHGYTPYRPIQSRPPTSTPEHTLSRLYTSSVSTLQRELPSGLAMQQEKKTFVEEPEIVPEVLFPLDTESEDPQPSNEPDTPVFNWKVFTTRPGKQESTQSRAGLSSFRERPTTDRIAADYARRPNRPTGIANSVQLPSLVTSTTVASGFRGTHQPRTPVVGTLGAGLGRGFNRAAPDDISLGDHSDGSRIPRFPTNLSSRRDAQRPRVTFETQPAGIPRALEYIPSIPTNRARKEAALRSSQSSSAKAGYR